MPNSLEAREGIGVQDQGAEKKGRFLRVRVLDRTNGDHPAVNVKVPIGVVKWGMNLAQTFSPPMKDVKLDWDSITEMVKEGETGKIVEVQDEAQHKTVEVWVE